LSWLLSCLIFHNLPIGYFDLIIAFIKSAIDRCPSKKAVS
jgi:hypothetical protein